MPKLPGTVLERLSRLEETIRALNGQMESLFKHVKDAPGSLPFLAIKRRVKDLELAVTGACEDDDEDEKPTAGKGPRVLWVLESSPQPIKRKYRKGEKPRPTLYYIADKGDWTAKEKHATLFYTKQAAEDEASDLEVEDGYNDPVATPYSGDLESSVVDVEDDESDDEEAESVPMWVIGAQCYLSGPITEVTHWVRKSPLKKRGWKAHWTTDKKQARTFYTQQEAKIYWRDELSAGKPSKHHKIVYETTSE